MSVGRVACVCVPQLALQVLLRDRPDWRALPVAVVADDRPEAFLLALNGRARGLGLDVTMRQGAARALAPTLRSAAVAAARIAVAVDELTAALRGVSPRVEPERDEPGVFVVDPTGMGRLHRDARAWAQSARRAVASAGFAGSVALGFDRRAARAVARHARGVVVARTADEERALAGEVPLASLGLDGRLVATLGALGVRTLGALWALPPDTVRHRFGDAAAALRAWVLDDARVPVQPLIEREPLRAVVELEAPDDDLARILFGLRGALHRLVAGLAGTGEAVASLALTLALEDRSRVAWALTPAAPTRDVALLIELARLRWSESTLPSRVVELTAVAEPAPWRGEQLSLFVHDRDRDRGAATRALARVRAAFGERAVTLARLREAHLPEARFGWEPLADAPPPRGSLPAPSDVPAALVRRWFVPPRELSPEALRALSPMPPGDAPPWLRAMADNDLAQGAAAGPWPRAIPTRVNGGWWARTVTRDYYYAESAAGELLWVFFDGRRGRWFVQAVVD